MLRALGRHAPMTYGKHSTTLVRNFNLLDGIDIICDNKPLTYHANITPYNLPELKTEKIKYIASDIAV